MTCEHSGGEVKKESVYSQRHLFLVYKQKINLLVETKQECYTDSVKDRFIYYSYICFAKKTYSEGEMMKN